MRFQLYFSSIFRLKIDLFEAGCGYSVMAMVAFREEYSRSDIDRGKAVADRVGPSEGGRPFASSDEPFAPARGSGFTVPEVLAP